MARIEPSAFQNETVERDILGYIASKPKDNQSIIEALTESDFHNPQHAQIFKAMYTLKAENKPVDLRTVNDRLMSTNGADKLDELLADCLATKACSTEWQANEYVKIIKKAANRRRLLNIFEAGKASLMDESCEIDTVFESARKELHDMLSDDGNETISNSEVIRNAFEHIERIDKGEEKSMPSGICTLDKYTKGFHRGELTIIGARPAVGKSALGMHIANTSARNEYNVLYCSREMSDIQLGTRELARGISFSSDKLRGGGLNDGEWAQLADSMVSSSQLPITYTFKTKYIEDLRRLVQRMVDSEKLDLLIVDYTQLMQTRRQFDQDYRRIGYVSKALKDMSIDFNIAVVALAQVGRSSENDMPTMAELRGSGDIEQDADNIIFMHRPTDVNDRWIDERDKDRFTTITKKGYQYVAINIAKQRQGVVGGLAVIFNPNNQIYTAITRD